MNAAVMIAVQILNSEDDVVDPTDPEEPGVISVGGARSRIGIAHAVEDD